MRYCRWSYRTFGQFIITCCLIGSSFAQEPNAVTTVTIKLDKGVEGFPNITNQWGSENLSVHATESQDDIFMRVFVPKGAIDPATMKSRGLPRGGAGFKSRIFFDGVNRAVLSYRVRFPEGFDFVRGGKLPGLYGGKGNSGGKIPDGTDGFSFRLMWGKDGRGNVYAYLPTSVKYGSGLLVHKFGFRPGQWHQIMQELVLNDPGAKNGILRMWVDGVFIGEETSILIRNVDRLKINGIFFDVFFGGNDDTWAPPNDTHIDFSNFIVRGFTNPR